MAIGSWQKALQKVVDTKAVKKLRNKAETTQMIKVYASNAENIIQNICKTNRNKRIFAIIEDWLHILHKVPHDRIRTLLYNIEQFKADALKQPEL